MAKNADYSRGKLLPMILRFSIPASISLLITAVYNIVDRIFFAQPASDLITYTLSATLIFRAFRALDAGPKKA